MTPVKFESNLRQHHRALDRMSEKIVEELAEEVVRFARRRIARDTGVTARSISYEVVSTTLARVGAGKRPGLFLEVAEHLGGKYEWLEPSIEGVEAVSQAIATALVKSEAARLAARTR